MLRDMCASLKRQLIEELITAFRASGNQDRAFDDLAANRLGVNRTDLHCLNAIEGAGSLTAGELAAEVGLTSGAVTGVVDRLERVNFARRFRDAYGMPPSEWRERAGIVVDPHTAVGLAVGNCGATPVCSNTFGAFSFTMFRKFGPVISRASEPDW